MSGQCWFCEKNPPSAAHARRVGVHKILKRDFFLFFTALRVRRYVEQQILHIPRCAECSARQLRAEYAVAIVGCILMPMIFCGVDLALGGRRWQGLVGCGMLGLMVSPLSWFILMHVIRPYGIRSSRDVRSHPR